MAYGSTGADPRRDVAAFPNAAHLGNLLLEARGQMKHKQFCDWIKAEFKMRPEQAEQLIDIAYQSRRPKP